MSMVKLAKWVMPVGSSWKSCLNGSDVPNECSFTLIQKRLWIERAGRVPFWWGEKGSIMKWYPYKYKGEYDNEQYPPLTVKLMDITTRYEGKLPYYTAKFMVLTNSEEELKNYKAYVTREVKRD